MKWLQRVFAFVGFAMVSCGPKGGTDVGNGATVRANIVGYEKAPASSQKALVLASGVEVDVFWVVMGNLRLRQGASCSGGDNELDIAGPFAADLAGAGIVGELPEFETGAGDYCRFRMEFQSETSLPEGLPKELEGYSMLVQGKRADGVPFEIRSKENSELRLDAKNETFSLEDGENPLLVAFDLGTILGSIDLAGLSGDPILIDDDNNTDALRSFEAAVKRESRLFRDEDDSGSLSSDEGREEKELAIGN